MHRLQRRAWKTPGPAALVASCSTQFQEVYTLVQQFENLLAMQKVDRSQYIRRIKHDSVSSSPRDGYHISDCKLLPTPE